MPNLSMTEKSLERLLPYLVAVLSIVAVITLPLCITNFHTLHSSSQSCLVQN